jgi:hypothetical protein
MSDSERYRRLAADMRLLARKSQTSQETDSYMAISRSWDQLATEAERIEARRPEPRPNDPPDPALPI